MKKRTLLALSLLAMMSFATMSYAEQATPSAPVMNTATPVTHSVDTKPLTAQQMKMKDCAKSYHEQKIEKSQYKTFMTSCLKKDKSAPTTAAVTSPTPTTATPVAATPTATTPANTQKEKMKSCNKDAKTQKLTGDARKAFMKDCLSNK